MAYVVTKRGRVNFVAVVKWLNQERVSNKKTWTPKIVFRDFIWIADNIYTFDIILHMPSLWMSEAKNIIFVFKYSGIWSLYLRISKSKAFLLNLFVQTQSILYGGFVFFFAQKKVYK